MDVPYSTWLLASSFVVHVITALLYSIELAVGLLIVSESVFKLVLPLVDGESLLLLAVFSFCEEDKNDGIFPVAHLYPHNTEVPLDIVTAGYRIDTAAVPALRAQPDEQASTMVYGIAGIL